MQLYLVKMFCPATGESFFKIGVTQHDDVADRFSFGKTKLVDSKMPLKEVLRKLLSGQKYISDHPYGFEVMHSVEYLFEGDALIAEKDLLNALKSKQYWPMKNFSGKSECFNGDDELLRLIVKYMNEDSSKKNSAAPDLLRYKLQACFVKEPDPIKKHLLVLEKCNKQ